MYIHFVLLVILVWYIPGYSMENQETQSPAMILKDLGFDNQAAGDIIETADKQMFAVALHGGGILFYDRQLKTYRLMEDLSDNLYEELHAIPEISHKSIGSTNMNLAVALLHSEPHSFIIWTTFSDHALKIATMNKGLRLHYEQ